MSETPTTSKVPESAVTTPANLTETKIPEETTTEQPKNAEPQKTGSVKTESVKTKSEPELGASEQSDVADDTVSSTEAPSKAIRIRGLTVGLPEIIDNIPSRRLDPVSAKRLRHIRARATQFIQKQRILEGEMNKDHIRKRRNEKEMRYDMTLKTVRDIMAHPYYSRMLKYVTEQMITEEQIWRRYKPHPVYVDNFTTRKRIQNGVNQYFMEYALKYSKRPWAYIGKNKIKTKFYEEMDWVDVPFDVLEEKEETDVKKQSVKAKDSKIIENS